MWRGWGWRRGGKILFKTTRTAVVRPKNFKRVADPCGCCIKCLIGSLNMMLRRHMGQFVKTGRPIPKILSKLR